MGKNSAASKRLRHNVGLIGAFLFAFNFLALGSALGPSAQAGTPTLDSATSSPGAISASTSIIMTNLSGLDLAAGRFDSTFYVTMTCSASCDVTSWDILNTKSMKRELVFEDELTSSWLVSGTFTFSPDLSLFPFDTQKLPINIEHSFLEADSLVFLADDELSEVSADIKISGWELEDYTITSSTTSYPQLKEDYSRLTFTVPLTRSTLASVTKFYIPLAIFVLLGAATLVLARNDFQIRTGGTALVGLTIFYLASSGGVGFTGAFTVWDASILLSYLALGLVLACGIVGAYLYHEGAYEGPEGEARAKRLRFRYLRILVGLVLFGAIAIAVTAIAT